MDTDLGSGAVAWRPASFSCLLDAMRQLVQRTASWLVAQRRAADDGVALAQMTDRELADIGIPRASTGTAAERSWTRDPGY